MPPNKDKKSAPAVAAQRARIARGAAPASSKANAPSVKRGSAPATRGGTASTTPKAVLVPPKRKDGALLSSDEEGDASDAAAVSEKVDSDEEGGPGAGRKNTRKKGDVWDTLLCESCGKTPRHTKWFKFDRHDQPKQCRCDRCVNTKTAGWKTLTWKAYCIKKANSSEMQKQAEEGAKTIVDKKPYKGKAEDCHLASMTGFKIKTKADVWGEAEYYEEFGEGKDPEGTMKLTLKTEKKGNREVLYITRHDPRVGSRTGRTISTYRDFPVGMWQCVVPPRPGLPQRHDFATILGHDFATILDHDFATIWGHAVGDHDSEYHTELRICGHPHTRWETTIEYGTQPSQHKVGDREG